MSALTMRELAQRGHFAGCPGCGAGITTALIVGTDRVALFNVADVLTPAPLTVVLRDSGGPPGAHAWPWIDGAGDAIDAQRWEVHICAQMRLQAITGALDRVAEAIAKRRLL